MDLVRIGGPWGRDRDHKLWVCRGSVCCCGWDSGVPGLLLPLALVPAGDSALCGCLLLLWLLQEMAGVLLLLLIALIGALHLAKEKRRSRGEEGI